MGVDGDGEPYKEMMWMMWEYDDSPLGVAECFGMQSSMGAHGFGTFQCEYPNGDVCHGKIRPKNNQLVQDFECPPYMVSSWDDVRLFCGRRFDCGGAIYRTDCVQCADEKKDEYWTEGTFMCFAPSDEEEEVPACVGAVDSTNSGQLELPPCPSNIDSCSDDDYLAVCEDPFDETEELAVEHREKKEHKDSINGLESYLGILERALQEHYHENDHNFNEKDGNDLQDEIKKLEDVIDEARELEWDHESHEESQKSALRHRDDKLPGDGNPDCYPRDDKLPGDGKFCHVALGDSPFDWKIRVECPERKSFRAALKQCDPRAGTFRCRSKQTGQLCSGKVLPDLESFEAAAAVALE
jgi:hypothetical protein